MKLPLDETVPLSHCVRDALCGDRSELCGLLNEKQLECSVFLFVFTSRTPPAGGEVKIK